MSKRVGFSYLASCLLPFLALVILMLRLFHPWSRYAAVGAYLIGCISLIFAMRRHVRVRNKLSRAKNHAWEALEDLGLLKKRAAFALLVFGSALLLFPILLPMERGDYLVRSQTEIRQEFERAETQMRRSERVMASAHEEFQRLALQVDLRDPESTKALRHAWAAYLDHAVLLDRLVDTHKHFYQLVLRSPTLADRAFLIGYQALVVQMHHGHHVARAVDNRPAIEALLNEPNDELGLSAQTYLRFAKGLTRAESLVQLEAGYTYLNVLAKMGHLDDTANERDRVLQLAKDTIRLFGKDPQILVDTSFDRFEKRAFRAWFPLQKGTAKLISPVRTKHRDNFISQRDLTWARNQLQAGDILLQRRNWYLTNLGIPGFWSHAAMYVGTPAELDEEFGPQAREATDGLAPSEFIRTHQPRVFAAFGRLDKKGRAPRVIEAIGDGVIIQPFERSGHADYMAALRPRLSNTARLRAVLEAFTHFGKPYDYNFEFSTDESVVCSELVYKALAKRGGGEGVEFTLASQNGRFVLPPNDIAKTFDQEYGTHNQQMDFIFFLDGNEALGRATFNDLEAFRGSWRRKKWDIAQP